MSKRKPSVYRKLRGITDGDIRQALQHLYAKSVEHEKRLTELHTLATAIVVRVFPEKVAEMEAAKVAAETVGACPSCYGFGHFETKRLDGTVDREPCTACQPIPEHGLGAVEDDTPVAAADAG